MKRDMSLIRKILLFVEDNRGGLAPRETPIDGYTMEEVGYHCYLVMQAGYAVGHDTTGINAGPPEAMLWHLTWEGYEFLDAARDESRWKSAMQLISDKAGSLPVAVLTQLLAALAKQHIGLQ